MVNTVTPALIFSNPIIKKQWQSFGSEKQGCLTSSIALKKMNRLDGTTHTRLFFVSEQAGWITKAGSPLDGGRL